jgi:AcrR family transcriptional regulator
MKEIDMPLSPSEAGTRRTELLQIAADLFAQQGFKNTTVRDIANAAGILSGSLYHHFNSKESMVDEILSDFQDELLQKYDEIVSSELDIRAKFVAIVKVSFDAVRDKQSAVAIYQNETAYLGGLERFGHHSERIARMRGLWIGLLEEGIRDGAFRAGIDTEVVYRFIRDTVWVAAKWYRPDGHMSIDALAEEYLGILLDGIAVDHD